MRGALAVLFLVGGGAAAWAQGVPVNAKDGAACRSMEKAGWERAEVGSYNDARTFYLQAYSKCRDPVNLVRVARTFQDQGDDRRALEFVNRFLLEAAVDHPLRDSLEEAKRELQERVVKGNKNIARSSNEANRQRRTTTDMATELEEMERRRAKRDTEAALAAASDSFDYQVAEQDGRNAIYAEGAGAGLFYSLNYERRISDVAVRLGVGYLRASASADGASASGHFVTIPFTLSYNGIRSGAHIFELGAGVTPIYLKGEASTIGDSVSGSGFTAWGTGLLGYRYQPSTFLFRTGLTLLAGVEGLGFVPWLHLSLGLSF